MSLRGVKKPASSPKGFTLFELSGRIGVWDNLDVGAINADANIDLRLGKKTGVVVEYGIHRHLDKDCTLQNYGLSVYAPFEIHNLLGSLSL